MPVVNRQQPPKTTPVKPPSKTTKPQTQTSKSDDASLNVVDRIRDLSFNDNDGIKLMVYGKSGTGKTTFWSTFPGPILAVLCSGGFKPGELRSLDTPEMRAKVKTVTLHKSEELRTLVGYVAANPGRFKTVVLDHVSGFQDLTMREILGLEKMPAQLSWGVAEQQDWQQSTSICKESIRDMLNLDQHVVIVGQEMTKEPKDKDSEVVGLTVSVAATPALAGWLAPSVDYTVQALIRPVIEKVVTEIGDEKVVTEQRGKGVEFCLRTERHDVFITKFRLPKKYPVPDFIVDPTFDKIYNLIKTARTAAAK